jgi:hypothetical protein
MSEYPDLRGPGHSEKKIHAGKKSKAMRWWLIGVAAISPLRASWRPTYSPASSRR